MLNDQYPETSSQEDRRRPLRPPEIRHRAYAGSRLLCVDPTRTASAISINSSDKGKIGEQRRQGGTSDRTAWRFLCNGLLASGILSRSTSSYRRRIRIERR